MRRGDPGPCPICDAPHCSCGGGGPIAVVQLPARDAAAAVDVPGKPGVFVATRSTSIFAPASDTPLGDGTDGRSFSTATYRGNKHRNR